MKNTILPNGLPIYKLMGFKPTGEKCQILKVNKEVLNTDVTSEHFGRMIKPLSVNIQIFAVTNGIKHFVYVNDISQYDLEIWNEKMTPDHEITYLTRKRQARTVYYKQTIL